MIMSALPVRSQKMEALGTMAGGIAHDFNSMLAPIISYGELAQQCVGEGSPLRRYLDNIMPAASRPRELADRVLAFGRTGLTHRTPVEIQRVVAETLEPQGVFASIRPFRAGTLGLQRPGHRRSGAVAPDHRLQTRSLLSQRSV
jgi:signal transduction histidine kinase